ncbi:MAG: hypothetical protein V3V22_06625 [Methylococcales bacterium]
MTTHESKTLIDVPLVPDPDADEEMGGSDIEAIADEDLRGSRLLLVRRTIEPIELEDTMGGVIQLTCTFQPSHQARFTSAQFRLRLVTPDEIRVIDLAPRSLDDPNPVEISLNRKGNLAVSSMFLKPTAEMALVKKYVKYHCRVQGSGAGTKLVRWDFRESPDRHDGIGQEQVLTFTLPMTGQVTGSVMVSARLAREGLRGRIEAIRDMILGVKPNERSYPISFAIPSTPSPSGLEKILRLL